VTENLRHIPTASATAAEIRARILEETGLTASAGISYNKLLASWPPTAASPTANSSSRRRWGGIRRGLAGRQAPRRRAGHRRQDEPARHFHRRRSAAAVPEFLRQHFGKSGAWYHAIARGEDDRPVVPDRPRKSSGSETTFANDLTDPAAIEAGVQAMADEVWDWCEKRGRLAGP
jgi:DNA polymerase-4